MSLKMLVTLDGSTFSEGILDTAIAMATNSQATVYLLRVNSPAQDIAKAGPNFDPRGESEAAALTGRAAPDVRIREIETATQQAERQEIEALEYLRPVAERFPAPVQCLVRAGSQPAQEIIKVAEELGVDLIAMATHGRSGLAHLFAGSVAEAVLRSAKFPVLLTRPRA